MFHDVSVIILWDTCLKTMKEIRLHNFSNFDFVVSKRAVCFVVTGGQLQTNRKCGGGCAVSF